MPPTFSARGIITEFKPATDKVRGTVYQSDGKTVVQQGTTKPGTDGSPWTIFFANLPDSRPGDFYILSVQSDQVDKKGWATLKFSVLGETAAQRARRLAAAAADPVRTLAITSPQSNSQVFNTFQANGTTNGDANAVTGQMGSSTNNTGVFNGATQPQAAGASVWVIQFTGVPADTGYVLNVSDPTGGFAQSTGLTVISTDTFTTAGAGSWVCPAGVTSVTVECWGSGGKGGAGDSGNGAGAGGGGGGYVRATFEPIPGTTYDFQIGTAGGSTLFLLGTPYLSAAGGQDATDVTPGSGGGTNSSVDSSIFSDIDFENGGDGGDGGGANGGGGGGGGSAYINGTGSNGAQGAVQGVRIAAIKPGQGGGGAGAGGDGGAAAAPGNDGIAPGGGGGGSGDGDGTITNGADGKLILTWY